MTEITAVREKEKAKYEAIAADLSKAVSSLEGAIADMQAGKGASFLAVNKGIRKSIAIVFFSFFPRFFSFLQETF